MTVIQELISEFEEIKKNCKTLHELIFFDGVLSIIEGKYLEKEKEQQKQNWSNEEVLEIIKNVFNQGERYGWDSHKSIENIDEMKNKIPATSLKKIIEKFKNK